MGTGRTSFAHPYGSEPLDLTESRVGRDWVVVRRLVSQCPNRATPAGNAGMLIRLARMRRKGSEYTRSMVDRGHLWKVSHA